MKELERLCAISVSKSHLGTSSNQSSFVINWLQTEALAVLLSKNSSGLLRALTLPEIFKSNGVFQLVIEISTSLWIGNYSRAIRLSKRLPLTLRLAFHIQLAKNRELILQVYEKGYRTGQGTKFPLVKLASYLGFDSIEDTSVFCIHHGLLVDEQNNCVLFKAGAASKIAAQSTPYPVPLNATIETQLVNVDIGDFLHGESI